MNQNTFDATGGTKTLQFQSEHIQCSLLREKKVVREWNLSERRRPDYRMDTEYIRVSVDRESYEGIVTKCELTLVSVN